MKTILIALLCTQLSGCWFVYIPGSAIDAIADGLSGASGNACVGSSATVGGKVRNSNTGASGTVTAISGPSSRCREATPIRATVAYE